MKQPGHEAVTLQKGPCPGCGKPFTVGSLHNVCVSDDRRYRYWLEARLLGDPDEVCLFLMLNPSKAGACRSDRTINRCKEFAEQWGYGTLWVCNLYAFRSSTQTGLRAAGYPVGPDNDQHLREAVHCADKIVLAWGSNVRRDRVSEVLQTLRDKDAELYVLASPTSKSPLTANDEPRHPLPRNNSLPVKTTRCAQVIPAQTTRGIWRLRFL